LEDWSKLIRGLPLSANEWMGRTDC
jgi:hypothetical protein